MADAQQIPCSQSIVSVVPRCGPRGGNRRAVVMLALTDGSGSWATVEMSPDDAMSMGELLFEMATAAAVEGAG